MSSQFRIINLYDHDMTHHGTFVVPISVDLQKEYDILVAAKHITTVAQYAALLPKSKRFPIIRLDTQMEQIK